MRKPIRLILVVLLVAVLGTLAWLVFGTREPSFKGKTLSYWVDPSSKGGHETDAGRATALAAMSGRAVPFLIERLRWHPSPAIQSLYQRFPNFPLLIRYQQGAWDPRGEAAHALGELGPLASNAVPDLIIATNTTDLGSSWYPRICAQAALIKIKRESLDPYIEKLKDTSVNGLGAWYQNALMIGEFGTNATAAIPNLISALGPTNHEVIQAHALLALGEIHSLPEISLPAMVPFLTSRNVALRQKAVLALGQFHDAAKPAWTNLIQNLQDSDEWTRYAARESLKKIDAQAAAEAGVK